MTITVTTLVAVFAVWLLACVWCGYRVRVLAFVGVVLMGLALNMVWMTFGLNARPFEVDALMAQTAAIMCGVGAFGVGWLAGRMVRQWRDSRVEVQTD